MVSPVRIRVPPLLLYEADGEHAFVQVKTGAVSLPASDYADLAKKGRVFLFATGEDYGNSIVDNVRCLERRKLVAFARSKRSLLPSTVRLWMDWADER